MKRSNHTLFSLTFALFAASATTIACSGSTGGDGDGDGSGGFTGDGDGDGAGGITGSGGNFSTGGGSATGGSGTGGEGQCSSLNAGITSDIYVFAANESEKSDIAPPADCSLNLKITAYDGDYVEELSCIGTGAQSCSCSGAWNRPGTYSVTAELQGVTETKEVTVVAQGCSVETVDVSFFQ